MLRCDKSRVASDCLQAREQLNFAIGLSIIFIARVK